MDNKEALADLCALLSSAEESYKYLLMCLRHPEEVPEDSEKLDAELFEAFGDVRGACADFIKAFDFYQAEIQQML